MDLIYRAFTSLYPEREFVYISKVAYSGKFRPFNANIRMRGKMITLNLSRSWKSVDQDIVLGLAQELVVKLFKVRRHTPNMDLYSSYIKNLHKFTPKTKNDPVLENSFHRINMRYFDGILDRPNLQFGSRSFTKLGSYQYATDTITISTALTDDYELLDYVMYHELLHKKLQFTSKNGRSLHHSAEFRRLEAKFPNAQLLEKRLGRMQLKNRLFRFF